jgi:hypothetical protein
MDGLKRNKEVRRPTPLHRINQALPSGYRSLQEKQYLQEIAAEDAEILLVPVSIRIAGLYTW